MNQYQQYKEPRTIFDALDDIEREHGQEPSEDEAMKVGEKLSAQALSSPLVQRYIRLMVGSGRGPRITDPWMALAEQRMMAGIICAPGSRVRVVDGHPSSELIKKVRLAWAYWVSQTYLWTTDVFNAVKCCPLPSHIVAQEMLPFPFTYHSFEVAYGYRDVRNPSDAEVGESDGMLIRHTSRGLSVYSSLTKPDKSIDYVGGGLLYGTKYPEEVPPDVRASTGVVLSMLSFLNSEAAVVESRAMPRGFKRSGELAVDEVDKVVSVVTLRRSAREAIQAYESESKTFRHRWWVSGHFRAQWVPSLQAHRTTWIAPYIKGRPDAPMLDKVYAVTR